MKTKSRGREPTPPTPGTSHLEPFPPPSHLLPFILNGLSPGCGCHGHCLLAPGSWSGESVTSSPACKDRVWQVVEWPVEARVVGSDQNHPPNPLSQEVAPSKSKSSEGVRASGSGLGSVRSCRARVWSRGQPVSQLCLTGWAAGPVSPSLDLQVHGECSLDTRLHHGRGDGGCPSWAPRGLWRGVHSLSQLCL